MKRIATEWTAALLVHDPVLTCVATAKPEGNPGGRLCFGRVKRAWHVSNALLFIPPCCSKPSPALFRLPDVYFQPEVANVPVNIKIKVCNINSASSILYSFHAIFALVH
jgi:hypothetical protein